VTKVSEDYSKNRSKKLEETLRACAWKRVGSGLWEKEGFRLYVDDIGIFLYRLSYSDGWSCWRRTHGLSHNLITHLPECLIRFDGFTLNLLDPQ
jgi:hypothetical protein